MTTKSSNKHFGKPLNIILTGYEEAFKKTYPDTTNSNFYLKNGKIRYKALRKFITDNTSNSTSVANTTDDNSVQSARSVVQAMTDDNPVQPHTMIEFGQVRTSPVKKSDMAAVVADTGLEYIDNIDTLIREYGIATAPVQTFFSPTKLSNVITGTQFLRNIATIINYLTKTFGEQITGESQYAIIYSYRQEAEYPESFDTEFNYHLAQYKSAKSLPIDMLFYIDPELFDYLSTISRTSRDDDPTRHERFMSAYHNTIENTPALFESIRDFTQIVYTTPVPLLPNNLFIYSGVSPYAITNRELIQLLREPLLIYVKSFTLDLRVAIHFAHIRDQNDCFPNADTPELLGLLSRYGVFITEPNFKVIFIQKLIPEQHSDGSIYINGLAFISPASSWEAEVLKCPSNYALLGDPFMRVINGVQTIFIPVQLDPVEVVYDVGAQLAHVAAMYDEYKSPASGCSLSNTATQEFGGNSNKQTKKRNKTRKKCRSKRRSKRNKK